MHDDGPERVRDAVLHDLDGFAPVGVLQVLDPEGVADDHVDVTAERVARTKSSPRT